MGGWVGAVFGGFYGLNGRLWALVLIIFAVFRFTCCRPAPLWLHVQSNEI